MSEIVRDLAYIDPYANSFFGDIYCFFCSAGKDEYHDSSCIWRRANEEIGRDWKGAIDE